jgi:predicted ester cyclase
MENANKDFMLRWYNEVWNKGNEDIIDEMFHPDGIAFGLGDDHLRGPDGFKKFYKLFKKVLSNFNITVDRVLLDGNFATAMCTVKAMETKTGKPVNFSGVSISEVIDGQLMNAWNYFDFLTLNVQLGNINSEHLLNANK